MLENLLHNPANGQTDKRTDTGDDMTSRLEAETGAREARHAKQC